MVLFLNPAKLVFVVFTVFFYALQCNRDFSVKSKDIVVFVIAQAVKKTTLDFGDD